MVYVFGAFWLILGLAVFLVAMRSGRRAAPASADGADAGLESRAGQRWLTIGVVLLIAFGLVIPALVLADNASHKTSVAAGLSNGQRLESPPATATSSHVATPSVTPTASASASATASAKPISIPARTANQSICAG